MSDAADEIYRCLYGLTAAIETVGFERARDVVMAWEDIVSECPEEARWLPVFGSGVRHALMIAEDADECADTCTIRIAWSEDDRHMEFRFPADDAGSTLAPIIRRAVDQAMTGVTGPGE